MRVRAGPGKLLLIEANGGVGKLVGGTSVAGGASFAELGLKPGARVYYRHCEPVSASDLVVAVDMDDVLMFEIDGDDDDEWAEATKVVDPS